MRRNASISVIAAATCGAVLFGAPALLASTVLALDLAELTRRADEVVVGRVVSMQAEAAGRGLIVTRVVIRVEDGVAGRAGRDDELEVIVPGGELGSVGLRVHGAPVLADGARYLLFLERRAPSFHVVGMAQGALPLRATSRGLLVEPPGNLPGLVRAVDGRLAPASPAVAQPRRLAEVIEEVRRGSR